MITMRNRHEARLCKACEAPMAGESDRCWKCGDVWAPAPGPAGRPRSLRETTSRVLAARARRHHDFNRRNRPPATRALAATAKES
jgi:hypothetical protein